MSVHSRLMRRSMPLVLAILTLLGLAAGAGAPRGPATVGNGRPNIVFLLVDDLDAELLDHLPVLKALLTDQGTRFERYFLNVSLCCPSRTTILRGQYGHNTGILTNLPPEGGFEAVYAAGLEEATAATWLQAAGYRTVLMGKYLNGYPNTATPEYVPPGWSEWYSPIAGNAYGQYNYTLNENGHPTRYGNAPRDYMTDVIAGKSDDFIRRAAADAAPFFMYLSVYAPHLPSTPAPRHREAFPDARAPRPPSFNEADVSDKPPWISNRAPLRPAQVTRLDAAYRLRLQSMLAVEDLLRTLVTALEQTGQLANTYIVFSSDNGYHLGQHRLNQGKQAPYEEDIRVPLIVRGPGVPAGHLLPHLTGNVDLAPTFAALAGAATPSWLDGRSLLPLFGERPPPLNAWRQAYLLEHETQERTPGLPRDERTLPPSPEGPRAPGRNPARPPAGDGLLEPSDPDQELSAQQAGMREPDFGGLRTSDYTYVEYATGERELYDLRLDPFQLNNLAATAAPPLLAELSAWLTRLRACAGESCRSADAFAAR